MWIETTEGRTFIQEISRQVVSQVAPEEADLFDELLQHYFDSPRGPTLPSIDDDPLGSGLVETTLAAAPAAAAMAVAVLSYLSGGTARAVREENTAAERRRIQALFKPDQMPGGPPSLSKDQLDWMKKLARDQAVHFGFSPDKAETMTNALLGALAH